METVETRAGAAGLLAAAEGLRARTRTQLNGSWAPLLGFGLLALAAAPVARYAFNFGAHGRSIASYPAFAHAELIGLCVVHEPGTPCLEGEFDGAILRFTAWGVWFALLPWHGSSSPAGTACGARPAASSRAAAAGSSSPRRPRRRS